MWYSGGYSAGGGGRIFMGHSVGIQLGTRGHTGEALGGHSGGTQAGDWILRFETRIMDGTDGGDPIRAYVPRGFDLALALGSASLHNEWAPSLGGESQPEIADHIAIWRYL